MPLPCYPIDAVTVFFGNDKRVLLHYVLLKDSLRHRGSLMSEDELKPQVTAALRHFKQTGLRWSYIINGTLVIVGFVANYFLPHGWVVWPAVLAIGMLVMINEAVDRNGQGWPPLLIYASVAAVLTLWVLFAFIFSAIAPVLLFVGVPALAGVWRNHVVERGEASQARRGTPSEWAMRALRRARRCGVRLLLGSAAAKSIRKIP